jgi:5'-nucleotidase
VQRGDTPASIARRYLGEAARWPEIASANPGLDARSLQVGQVLRLPAGAVPVATEAQQAKVGKGPATGPGGAVAGGAPLATHRVADGDSLYNLARRYYGDASHWKLIQDANPALLGEGVKGLRLGSELVIPALPGPGR